MHEMHCGEACLNINGTTSEEAILPVSIFLPFSIEVSSFRKEFTPRRAERICSYRSRKNLLLEEQILFFFLKEQILFWKNIPQFERGLFFREVKRDSQMMFPFVKMSKRKRNGDTATPKDMCTHWFSVIFYLVKELMFVKLQASRKFCTAFWKKFHLYLA